MVPSFSRTGVRLAIAVQEAAGLEVQGTDSSASSPLPLDPRHAPANSSDSVRRQLSPLDCSLIARKVRSHG